MTSVTALHPKQHTLEAEGRLLLLMLSCYLSCGHMQSTGPFPKQLGATKYCSEQLRVHIGRLKAENSQLQCAAFHLSTSSRHDQRLKDL